jgi:uncharacterized protein (DUF2141 family)
MKKIMFMLLIFSWSIDSFAQSGKLIVKVKGLENAKGYLFISLYDINGKKGFPKEESALIKRKIDIKDLDSIAYDDLQYGEYAIILYHDENDNERLDSNIFGIPKEGIGVSNDAKSRFGPPKFEDAKFLLNKETLEIEINLYHVFGKK